MRDLRHTIGTLAVRRAEVPAVEVWMGHADIQTSMRYLHYRDRGAEARLLADAFRVEPLPDASRSTIQACDRLRPEPAVAPEPDVQARDFL